MVDYQAHKEVFVKMEQCHNYIEMYDNMNHGKHITYYSLSGRIFSESYWINDTIDGILTEYSEDGEIVYQVEYRKDEIIRVVKGVVPIIEE